MASQETTSTSCLTETGAPFASGSLVPHHHQHLPDLLMEEVKALLPSRVAFSEGCHFLGASLHLRMRDQTSTEKLSVADLDPRLHEEAVVCSAACRDATRQTRSV